MKTRSTLLLFFICFTATAQKSDSTRTYYRIIRGGMIEHAKELRTKRYVKNGLSEIKAGKTLVATGLYKEENDTEDGASLKHPILLIKSTTILLKK